MKFVLLLIVLAAGVGAGAHSYSSRGVAPPTVVTVVKVVKQHRVVAGWDCTAHPENEEACSTELATSAPAPTRTVVVITPAPTPAPVPARASAEQCAVWYDEESAADDRGLLSYDPARADALWRLRQAAC
jgi:hypothetical protein